MLEWLAMVSMMVSFPCCIFRGHLEALYCWRLMSLIKQGLIILRHQR